MIDRPAVLSTSLVPLRTWTAPEAVARLEAVAEALASLGDPQGLEALARSLPSMVGDLEPEVSMALASVAAALVPHGPVVPGDVAGLEPRLRIAWRRVQLAVGDAAALDGLDEDELLRVVHGWSIDPVLDPRPLVRRLTRAHDARLRMLALDWIVELVRQLAATPGEALAELLPLARDEEPTIRAWALGMLAESWLRGLLPAAERDRDRVLHEALAEAEPLVVRAAIDSAAALGRRDWLLERLLVRLGDADPTAAAAALVALGPLAQDEDLDVALELARRDPLGMGPAARRCLLAAHRHGVFLRARHLDGLLASFDADPGWTGEALVRVTFIVRTELVERLAALPPDDPRWIRRASILAASVGTRAHAVLREQLEQVRDLAVAQALIEAAGRSPDYEGEEPLLVWLDALPEVVIPVLRVKGGAEAEARLRARVEDPRRGATQRALAMGVLWALSRDRTALLRELSTRLGPHEAGLLDPAHRAHRDRRIARLVADAPWGDDPHHAIEPLRRLEILCESGDIDHLPTIVALFRELLRGYVRRALAGDFTIKRVALPELEQHLFRYGRHLVKEGRSVRRFIEPGPETGRDLVLQVAIDWLREEPAPAVCVALLELVARHGPGPTTLRLVEPLWRHGDREVRRAAIEAILAAGEGARGLELSLCRLAEHEEPRIMVQALAAVAALEAQWAEPIVLAALRRPEMAVKKEAARALTQIASARAVAPVVEWLAHHDNRGFRSELLAALRRAAGPSLVAVLVAALERETEPRRLGLLWDALGGHLPLSAALRLARSSSASHRRLLEACLDGRVALADADAETLAARLHRAKLLPATPQPDPGLDPGRRLRVEGFSPQAACALVDLRTPERESSILATVRLGLADWITWLRTSDTPIDPRALALVLDAAQPHHGEHVDALLELAEREHAAVDPGAVAGLLERCVAGRPVGRALQVRAIGLLRRLPPSAGLGGLRRHRLLGRLDAVRTRADLERCLDECRLGPHHARDTATLLGEAFQIPAAAPDERPELAAMRTMAEGWHACDEVTRKAWLAQMLAARPLDLDVVEPLGEPAKSPFQPSAQADLDALRATLREGDEQERSRAAARLLDWPQARAAWPQVLEAFLHGHVTLTLVHYAQIAPLLRHWPNEPESQPYADALLPHCAPWQHRAFVQTWVERWRAGDPSVTERLRRTDPELLLPLVWAAAERGDYGLVHLLQPSRSAALRALIAWVGARSSTDVEHLLVPDREPPPTHDDAEDPDDPIAGREPDELQALIERKGVAKGLAVRAVHALVTHGERGVAPLERLVTDARPPVRSAALRALRKVASRERTLQATARALAMETRRDVVLQLMKSLGHGRHEPSLPALLERLDHGDLRIRQGAHEAIRAWGHEVVPALRRAARRARPDRRPTFAALIAELEQVEAVDA